MHDLNHAGSKPEFAKGETMKRTTPSRLATVAVALAALWGCGGGGGSSSLGGSAAAGADTAAAAAGAPGAAAIPATATQTAAADTKIAPITSCDARGIGAAALTADAPATITEVSTGTAGTGASAVPYCLVKVRVEPAVNIWVALPTENQWNGRLQSEGGGGYAGVVRVATNAVQGGYIGIQTDTGHAGNGLDGSFGMLSPGVPNTQLQIDFAYRSEHLMAVIGKQLAQAFYGQQPIRSYWNGCSTGGRQGLRMAQDFPADYDGILAGAPAIHWDRFQAYQIWPQMVMRQETGGPIAAAKLALATSRAVAACDAQDGATDSVIGDPRQCTYSAAADASLTSASCTGTNNTCLTPAEARAVDRIWDGARNPAGKLLWYGVERDADLARGLAGATPFPIATEQPKFWVYLDPNWDWTTLNYGNYESFFKDTMRAVGPLMASENPDLSAFRDRGGKLVMWHGWSDQLIMPRGTIDYYEAVTNRLGGGYAATQQWARLFMAPGVAHCNGGSGAQPQGLFETVVRWVEQGEAPQTIAATATAGGVTRSRALCLYPTVSRYTGGDPNAAASYACVQP